VSSSVGAIERAAQLPLNDAAYFLWIRKWQLDREEQPSSQHVTQPKDLTDPKIFRRVIRTVIGSVLQERESAQYGSTFGRLKTAHPEATDPDLQNAIKSAVKLDTDCTRHFSYSKSGLSSDAHRAVELAREKNPDFSEATYKSAVLHLCTAMR
jgi:hypothetical protein